MQHNRFDPLLAYRPAVRRFSLLPPILCLLWIGAMPAAAKPGANISAPAGTYNQSSAKLKQVDIVPHMGVQIPPDLVFTDSTGKKVRLGDYFHSGRPIILTLVYFKCPMLCTLVLNNLERTMKIMPMSAGKDYDVLTISFNPREHSALAAKKKAGYLRLYDRPGAAAGWHFLTGEESQIKKLTQTVGFKYIWDPKYNQYMHASGLIILTPGGKVSRYFFKIEYNANDLRFALSDASGNKIGTVKDKVLFYCVHYDPNTGKYTLDIANILKIAGVLTVLGIGLLVTFMAIQERRRKLTLPPPPQPPPAGK